MCPMPPSRIMVWLEPSCGRGFTLIALASSIKLGWMYLTVTNQLAYFVTELLIAEKSFYDYLATEMSNDLL